MGISKKKRNKAVECKIFNPLKIAELPSSKEICIPKTPEPKKKKKL